MGKLKELIKNSPFFYPAWRIYTSYQNLELRKLSAKLGYDLTKDVKAMHRQKSKDAMQYTHSDARTIKPIFDSLGISPLDKILDYGSGKGGMMIWLAQCYPFGKIAGVEFCSEYDILAKQNFTKNGLSYLETYNVDAATFTDIDEYNYFYFFNPFIGETMNRVVANIRDSFLRHSRKMVVIYNNPRCREAFTVHHDIFPYQKFIKQGEAKNNPYHYGFIDIYSTESLNINFEKL
jgi:precorrin-6B methylase 2